MWLLVGLLFVGVLLIGFAVICYRLLLAGGFGCGFIVVTGGYDLTCLVVWIVHNEALLAWV